MLDEATTRIADILNEAVAQANAGRRGVNDPLGIFILAVLKAADPDDVFQMGARVMLRGYISKGSGDKEPAPTRKKTITMLAQAFGADRDALKEYLLRHSLCGPAD